MEILFSILLIFLVIISGLGSIIVGMIGWLFSMIFGLFAIGMGIIIDTFGSIGAMLIWIILLPFRALLFLRAIIMFIIGLTIDMFKK